MNDQSEPGERKRTIGETYAKLHRGFDPSPAIENLLHAHASATKKTESFRRSMEAASGAVKMPEPIDYSFLADSPERRAARASEQTAELLEALVSSAVASDARAVEAERCAVQAEERAIETERREQVMLRWTIASVILAAIAAAASIVTIVIG